MRIRVFELFLLHHFARLVGPRFGIGETQFGGFVVVVRRLGVVLDPQPDKNLSCRVD